MPTSPRNRTIFCFTHWVGHVGRKFCLKISGVHERCFCNFTKFQVDISTSYGIINYNLRYEILCQLALAARTIFNCTQWVSHAEQKNLKKNSQVHEGFFCNFTIFQVDNATSPKIKIENRKKIWLSIHEEQ